MHFDVIGLGTVLIDQQVTLSQYPTANTKNEVSAFRVQVGGPVPTALTLLSRFGYRCAFVGKWAYDAPGQQISGDLVAERIDQSLSIRSWSGETGVAHVWVDQTNGSRTVAYTRGTCGSIEPTELACSEFPTCQVLHLDGWSSDAALHAVHEVKRRGGRVVLDSGSPKPGMERLIPFVDLLNCPAQFATKSFPDESYDGAAARLLELGAGRVLITHGSEGAVLYDQDGRHVQPAFQVDAIDTTGAGDVFCGGLIHGLLQDWPAKQATQFAAAAAALKCQAMGNRDALPSSQTVTDFLRSQNATCSVS